MKKGRAMNTILKGQKSTVASEVLSLRVKCNDQQFKVKIEDNLSVLKLKQKINSVWMLSLCDSQYCKGGNFPVPKIDRSVIVFNGAELDDDAMVRNCGLANGSLVTYMARVVNKKTEKTLQLTVVNAATGKTSKTTLTDPSISDVYDYAQSLVGEKRFYILVSQDGKRVGKTTALNVPSLKTVVFPVSEMRRCEV